MKNPPPQDQSQLTPRVIEDTQWMKILETFGNVEECVTREMEQEEALLPY
jgi:hypothetical protein